MSVSIAGNGTPKANLMNNKDDKKTSKIIKSKEEVKKQPLATPSASVMPNPISDAVK